MVGYQPEARPDQTSLRDSTLQITDFLKQHIEENKLLFCTGSHKNVADKMRQCDIFFWHNLRSVNPDMFAGESMGLSHIEAAACGCVVIAKQNYVTQQIYPPELLCSSPEHGLQKLKFLLSHPDQKERLRIQCLQIAKNYCFDGFDNDRIETIQQITQIPGQPAYSQRLEEESFTQVNHTNHQKKNTKTISKENTCIMLIDLWPLSNQQLQQLGPVYLAWLSAREKIAELVKLANATGIPIYLQNNNWPISIPPASLKKELPKSNLIIAPEAFAEDGYKHNTSAGPPSEQLIKNTIDYRDYDNLIYAGFAADACLAQRNNYGYASVSDSHNKFIIKDATLVQHILYHGKVPQLWPEYSRVMKARGPDEPLPWKGPEDIINETIFFCDNFASKFCTPLFLDELKQMLPLSPAKKSTPTLIDGELKHSLDISFLMEADWGWGCFLEDYVLLYGVLSMIKPNKILEIGTNHGLGAVVLAKAASFLSESAHVTSIDIDQSKAKSNLHLIDGIENKITFIEENANTILPELAKKNQWYDFIFIDGAHDYEQASQDWKNCSVLSDTFAFHDTTQFTGLQQIIRELRYTNEFDIFQFASPPGHRIKPELRKETFSTGLTLVQRKTKLTEIPVCAHRDHYGQLLPGHSE
ncbi:MAG: CmcI family methyltransferase [Planctomycetota bacterium]